MAKPESKQLTGIWKFFSVNGTENSKRNTVLFWLGIVAVLVLIFGYRFMTGQMGPGHQEVRQRILEEREIHGDYLTLVQDWQSQRITSEAFAAALRDQIVPRASLLAETVIASVQAVADDQRRESLGEQFDHIVIRANAYSAQLHWLETGDQSAANDAQQLLQDAESSVARASREYKGAFAE